MLNHFKTRYGNDTPLIELLHHSKLLEQDLKKAAEKRMADQARTRSGRGTVRGRGR